MKRYKTVVSGGTFDCFHSGHQAFLHAMFLQSERVLIGITSDLYTKKYKTETRDSYAIRIGLVKDFLQKKGWLEHAEIAEIDSHFIPDVWENYSIDTIFVTDDTKKGADRINQKREKENKKRLPVIVVPQLRSEDGTIISATRIKKGEIYRDGRHTSLQLPEILRKKVREPFGDIYPDIDDLLSHMSLSSDRLIVVGDIALEKVREKGILPKVAVIDLFVERKKVYRSIDSHNFKGDEVVLRVKNPAGQITSSVFKTATKTMQDAKRYIVLVDGEEDLVVLPYVLAVPLGYHIVYGQPGQGIVVITVTKQRKQRARKLLEKFTILAS